MVPLALFVVVSIPWFGRVKCTVSMPVHLKTKSNAVSSAPSVDVSAIVKGVIDDIRANGDAAVRKYSEKFDKWSPASFKLSQAEIDAAIAACPKQTIDDIKEVQRNVRVFAQAQRDSIRDFEYEIQPVSRHVRLRYILYALTIDKGRVFGTEEPAD